MNIQRSLLHISLLILILAGLAAFTACAGVSTSAKSPTVSSPGSASSTHSVDLLWAPSTSADVSGYNVYRAPYTTACGSFSRLNSALLSTTWYTDSEVTNGASYCYATTAVDANNQESAYSNIVSDIQIPTS
jgi:fibronectin type 3 domain-containing protein